MQIYFDAHIGKVDQEKKQWESGENKEALYPVFSDAFQISDNEPMESIRLECIVVHNFKRS
ncbi:hypothetical protein SDC9_208070 [bioreactor metagenome]|uniref:ASCH domain-containing protein n=1 Tax=bioreactor metagenome TaxID=1076179 RepID=A0A645JB42_9ZZZZ